MISDEAIRAGYLTKFGNEIDQKNIDAFKRLMVNFDCADSETFEEGGTEAGLERFRKAYQPGGHCRG